MGPASNWCCPCTNLRDQPALHGPSAIPRTHTTPHRHGCGHGVAHAHTCASIPLTLAPLLHFKSLQVCWWTPSVMATACPSTRHSSARVGLKGTGC